MSNPVCPLPQRVPYCADPDELYMIPPKFYRLMRDDAAGLLDHLVPINYRAQAVPPRSMASKAQPSHTHCRVRDDIGHAVSRLERGRFARVSVVMPQHRGRNDGCFPAPCKLAHLR